MWGGEGCFSRRCGDRNLEGGIRNGQEFVWLLLATSSGGGKMEIRKINRGSNGIRLLNWMISGGKRRMRRHREETSMMIGCSQRALDDTG